MKKYILILFICSPSVLFTQWFPASNGIVDSVGLNDCKFVNENTAYTVGNYGYIYKTTNGAASWLRQNNNTINDLLSVFFVNENTGWAAGYSVILKTTNGGTNWFTQFTAGVVFRCIHFANENTGMTACEGANSIYKTINAGNNWFSLFNPAPFSDMNGVFMVDTSVAYAVGERFNNPAPVIKTTNGGVNWFTQNAYIPVNIGLRAVSFINTDTGLIGGEFGEFRYTSNGGNNWLQFNPGGSPSDFEYVNNKVVYMAIGYIYIKKSTNGGLNWIEQPTGNDNCGSVSFINENTGIAVGDRGAVYKTTNGGELGIIKTGNNIPKEYKLHQNYPNPFNPVTQIRYSIGKDCYVSINVYNAIGQEVIKIVNNEYKTAGHYSVKFDGTNLTSGIYFYKIYAGSYSETKKMVLIK